MFLRDVYYLLVYHRRFVQKTLGFERNKAQERHQFQTNIENNVHPQHTLASDLC